MPVSSWRFSFESRERRAPKSLARASAGPLIVSDFAAAEFAAAIARRVRMRDLTREQGEFALTTFDGWVSEAFAFTEISPADVALAAGFLRRLDLTLRAPDAIHIAVAQRVGALLVTFDERMATAARTLGVPVADI